MVRQVAFCRAFQPRGPATTATGYSRGRRFSRPVGERDGEAWTTLASIWLLQMAVMLVPGPNVLLVTQLAASDHARSAAFAALGLTVGAGIWATSAMLGINILFHAAPALRLALQIAGGLYLLYVAGRLWRSGSAATSGAQAAPASALAAFRLGFLTNITNPKSALFFRSVFASAFPPQPDTMLQVSAAVMIVVNVLCWHLLLAFLFSRGRVRAACARSRNAANRMASAAVGTLGLGLLVASMREAQA